MERKPRPGLLIDIRSLTFFALFGALMFVAKMAMASLPNIEPVSLMTVLLADVFGWPGLLSVCLYVFLEIFIWGAGFWSISYLYVWLILFCLAILLRKAPDFCQILLLGAFGLFFGFFCSWIYLPAGGLSATLAWWVSGIPFDLAHCAGNFVLGLLLYKPLRRVLITMKKRYFQKMPLTSKSGK